MYKKNSRYISKIHGCSLLQHSSILRRKRHAIGYYAYTQREWQAKQNEELKMK